MLLPQHQVLSKQSNKNNLSEPFDKIPESILHQQVSQKLKVGYLQDCGKSQQQIENQREYSAVLIRDGVFVSIPTCHPQLKKYVNVHYLINTGSQKTTLTHRALCAINQVPSSTDIKFQEGQYKIAGKLLNIRLSTPNAQEIDAFFAYGNLNMLGMDFILQSGKTISLKN